MKADMSQQYIHYTYTLCKRYIILKCIHKQKLTNYYIEKHNLWGLCQIPIFVDGLSCCKINSYSKRIISNVSLNILLASFSLKGKTNIES